MRRSSHYLPISACQYLLVKPLKSICTFSCEKNNFNGFLFFYYEKKNEQGKVLINLFFLF